MSSVMERNDVGAAATRKLLKALVVPDIDPKWGGPSVSVPALCRAMHRQDPSVRLYFAADAANPSWPEYFEPHRKTFPQSLRCSRSLKSTLSRRTFSMVHHHALWLPSLGYSLTAARASGCPLVISPRGMLSPYALRRSRFKKWLATKLLHPRALAEVAAWHATSDMEFQDIRAAGFQQPILVSANGVDRSAWDDATDRAAWLARHPELRQRRVCLFFSRLHSKKGLFPLLEMWSRLAGRHAAWRLLIVGTPEEYSAAQVRSEIARLRLSDRVTLADPRGLAKPYPLAELYVLPTQSENFGLTIGEALASGVPTLTTTDAPWQSLDELECGSCVPMAGFCARLDQLLSLPPEQLHEMGQRGQQWMEREFSWDRRAHEMLDFYQSISPQ